MQARLDAAGPTAIVDRLTGPATIASYTVAHGRDGSADWGLVVADVPDGGRAYGRVEDDELLAALEAQEWVGRTIDLVGQDTGVNLVRA